MTIQQHIKNDLVIAMREKNEGMKSILRVIIGEFNRVGKDVSDEQALSILKKMYQNAIDQAHTDEAARIELYLPKQMNEEELTVAIAQINIELGCSSIKDMGKVMAELKVRHNGTYDGKVASTIIKNLLV
jgi:uncharacterized protein